MSSTITSTITTAVTLSTGGAYQSPLTIATNGAVDVAGIAIDGPNTQAWTVANYGTVEGTGAGGVGIDLADGGSVANIGATSYILGANDAIYVQGAAGTVTNAGTIKGSGSAGIGIEFTGNFNDTVTNAGTIAGTGGQDAVKFGGGNDLLIVDSGAVFSGLVDGGGGSNTLELASTASTGTLTGLGTSFVNFGAITVDAGAKWVFAGANTIASGVTLTEDGTFTNSGTLTGAGTLIVDPGTMINTGYVGVAVTLDAGSYLDNTSTGLINVAGKAVYGDTNGADSVTNAGTIESSDNHAVALGGGNVTNSGTASLISGAFGGVEITTASGTVTNDGTILGAGIYIYDAGVYLEQGGSVANTGTASLISGNTFGVNIINLAGNVSNAGTITGTAIEGVVLHQGGSVANTGTAALISGGGNGLYITGGAGTVSNEGTITGLGAYDDGIVLGDGGSVANIGTASLIYGDGGILTFAHAAVTVSNDGTIRGGPGRGSVGIFLGDGGSVANTGTASLISGGGWGIRILGAYLTNGGAGTVSNEGTITGPNSYGRFYGYGVLLDQGGSVANTGTAALIHGHFQGIRVNNAAGIVTNTGTITSDSGGSANAAIAMTHGGSVANSATAGLISGRTGGVYFSGAAGTVSNAGTIQAAGAGSGVVFSGTFNDTVSNAGTIAGGSGYDAVLFAGGNDRLIVDPGAVFTGTVDGGAGNNTLELASTASTGTISGIGTSFVNFGTITVDAGAQWVLAGVDTLASGVTLTDDGTLTTNGTLTNSGILTGSGGLAVDSGTLVNSGSVGIAVTLDTGSYLDNTGAGTISVAGGNAVTGTGGTVSVVNAGTIASTSTVGIAVYLTDGGSVANTGSAALISGRLGIEIVGAAGTVSNAGTIAGIGTSVYLKAGGSVDNTGTITVSNIRGIFIQGAAGTVSNEGAITGGSDGEIVLNDGGSVTNTGLLSASGVNGGGVEVFGAAGTVSNLGTIAINAGKGIYLGNYNNTVINAGTISVGRTGGYDAVLFGSGNDRLIVDPGAVFVGYVDGGGGANTIELASAASTGTLGALGTQFINFNAIIVDAGAKWVVSGNDTTAPVTLNSGAYLDNKGTISVAGTAVTGAGGAVSVVNSSTISGTGTTGIGVYLTDGGSVANTGTSALISGGNYGVEIAGAAGTVTNSGTIVGATTVLLSDGGVVNNNAGALISTPGNTAVSVAYGTVTNYGTITASKVAVFMDGGSILNRGTAALISVSNVYAVELENTTSAYIGNAGTIEMAGSYGRAIDLGLGGTVNNSGLIYAPHAIAILVADHAGTVTNTGSIIGHGFAVYLTAGGSVGNTGGTALIEGTASGLVFQGGAGTVTNAGTIEATNNTGAGVRFVGNFNDTVVNSGTIAAAGGADAVRFAGGNDLLKIYPGAVFVSNVDGGTGNNTIELASAASTGTLTGLGSSYVNFGTVTVDSGAGWTIAGSGTIANALTLTGAGSLTNAGTLTGAGSLIVDPMSLTNSGSIGVPVTLDAGSYLDNTSTGTISTNGNAVDGFDGAVNIVNAGTIEGTGGFGIFLDDGSSVDNTGTTALISGKYGIRAPGAITNNGTIRGTVDSGAILFYGGTITNNGTAALISGQQYGIFAYGAAGTVINAGTIIGVTRDGIQFGDFNNTVTNAGTIIGASGLDAVLFGGGDDRLIVDPGAVFTGTVDGGGGTNTLELASGTGGTLSFNSGTIVGPGGTYVNFADVAIDSGANWTIAGGSTITSGESIANGGTLGIAGTVTNAGTITAGNTAVAITGTASTLINSGTISSNAKYGIYLNQNTGQYVKNSGYVRGGPIAIFSRGATSDVTVVNTGTMIGGNEGILLKGAGTIVNSGTAALIYEQNVGNVTEAGVSGQYGNITVINAGTISGFSGVNLRTDGAVINQSTGMIVSRSGGAGVYFKNEATGTVDNAGAILAGTAGYAVRFNRAGGLVIDRPGAVFQGKVAVDSSYSARLELASSAATGTLTGLGASFVNFAAVTIDTGAKWLFTGGNTIASGSALSNLGSLSVSGTLNNAGTLINSGTLSGTGTLSDAGTLSNSGSIAMAVTLTTGGYLHNTGTVSLIGVAVIDGGSGVSVANAGTIIGTGGNGVYLRHGGSIANSGTAALISGSTGIAIIGQAGTVTNSGTVSGSNGAGVYLLHGGSIANAGAAALISGYAFGIVVNVGGTVTNSGTIKSAHDKGLVFNGTYANTLTNSGTIIGATGFDAVRFGAGDDLMIVDPGAVFTGTVDGGLGSNTLELGSGAGAGTITLNGTTATGFGTTFVNFGTLAAAAGARLVLTGYGTDPVALNSGAYLENTGTETVSVSGTAVTGAGGPVTIVNTGTIASTTGAETGIYLADGGSVSNVGAASYIKGAPYSVVIAGAAGTVTNQGSIFSVYLKDGGSINNSGFSGFVKISGAAGTVTNSASLIGGGYGVVLQAGGSVDNTGTIRVGIPFAQISVNAVYGEGGAVTVTNGGYILSYDNYGVALKNGGSVGNSGTIIGQNVGVALLGGGTITNSNAASTISGHNTGILTTGQPATVANSGTISGGVYSGVYLKDGGSIANTGAGALIEGHGFGVAVAGAAGTITNAAKIEATGGTGFGVEFFGNANDTLTNSGTIIGTGGDDAVKFGSGNGRLIIDPGAVFTGTVDGGSGSNTLELASGASTGTLSGLGASFVNFGTLTVDAGADWAVTGGNTIASDTTLNDAGTLNVDGTLTNSGTLTGPGTLIVEPGTLVNSGYVGIAVTLDSGSYLDNTTSGTIAAASGNAVYGTGGAASVVNAGTISDPSADGAGIYLADGGSVANTSYGALISSGSGIEIAGAAGTVTNSGTIASTSATGVYFKGSYANTLTNAGTIAGGGNNDAVKFGGGDDLLIVDPGAVFSGTVDGGLGSNTLEFGSGAGTGTITLSGTTATGFGATFVNFGTLAVAAGASLVLEGSAAAPVTLNSGSYLDNIGKIATTGDKAVIGTGAAVGVVNAGTITTSGNYGVYLHDGGSVDNSTTAALISADRFGIAIFIAPATVTNYGSVAGQTEGIYITAGGSVANIGSAAHISGGFQAVRLRGGLGILTNTGTIAGVSVGVYLESGGSVGNSGTAALISGAYGIEGKNVLGGVANTVTNAGTIMGAEAGIYFAGSFNNTVSNAGTIAAANGHDAVQFGAGNDTLIVDPGAVFTGNVDGATGNNTLELASSASTGTLSGLGTKYLNFGTLLIDPGAKWVFGGGNTIASGVTLTEDGTFTNTGTLTDNGTLLINDGTFTNSGTVSGSGSIVIDPSSMTNTGYVGVAVTLDAGSYLDNTSTGTIKVAGNAVVGTGGAVTVTNAGTISGGTGPGGVGIQLNNGGSVANTGGTARISGYADGVYAKGAAGTVTNTGTISAGGGEQSDGVRLKAGGSVVNGHTGSTAGLISGGDFGVAFGVITAAATGTVSNYGTITAGGVGVVIYGGGSLVNAGTITGPGGVASHGNSYITNRGSIAGIYGVRISAGTVTNSGSIAGTYLGVAIGGGTLINTGAISGEGYYQARGVYLGGNGESVANTSGTAVISGYQFGIFVSDGGAADTVTNTGTIGATGTAPGLHGTGIFFGNVFGDTVTNAGTIAGAYDAIYFDSGTNRLIVDPGAVFIGRVNGDTGDNTLELASGAGTGTISGIGTSFINFGTLTVDAGAKWVLAGTNSLASGVTLTSFGSLNNSGTLTGNGALVIDPSSMTNTGSIGVAVTLDAGSYLDNTSTGTIKVAGNAVTGTGGAVSVVNAGTIQSTASAGIGIFLGGGGSIANTGTGALISGGAVGVDLIAAGTVTNMGTIAATGTAAINAGGASLTNEGVILAGGGSVGNTGTAALIDGYLFGVYVTGAAGIVSNAGTIEATGTAGIGIKFAGSNSNAVTNAGTIAGAGGQDAILFGGGNDRLIVDPGAVFTGNVDGGGGSNVLELASGASTGTISGLGIKYLNFGAIVVDPGASWVVSGSNVPPVTIGTGGYFDNAGTLTSGSPVLYYQHGIGFISVGPVAVYGTGSAVSAVNTGTISLGGNPKTGIFLRHGGSVDNIGTAAYISAYSAGIRIAGGAGTVTNSGTITSSGNYFGPNAKYAGVELFAGGSVGNSGVISGGSIYISGGRSIYISGGAGTVTNSGAIGYIQLAAAGGSVANTTTAAQITGNIYFGNGFDGRHAINGTITNAGTISGYIRIGSGSIANTGTAALISGQIGFAAAGGATVTNAGTISEGIIALYGASLDNTGVITGDTVGSNVGIGISGVATVSNSGTIEGSGVGDSSAISFSSGSIGNTGTAALIRGFDGILLTGGTGTVTNVGTINGAFYSGSGGANAGIIMYRPSTSFIVSNETGALISSPEYGIYGFQGAAGTITNDGTITGGSSDGIDLVDGGASTVINTGTIAGGSGHDAVVFGSGNDRLVVDPGAVFTGNVDGGGGINTLELGSGAGIGTITGLGSKYLNFDAITVDAGARWVISGNAAAPVTLGAGAYLDNLGSLTSASGDVVSSSAGAVTIVNDGTITASGGNGIHLSGAFNDTVTNAGTIAGSPGQYSVLFGNGNDTLIVDPGAVFTGTVGGAAGANTLELASAASIGTIGNIGASFAGFGSVVVEPGADWKLSGSNTLAATITSGATLELLSGATGSGTIAFAAASGTLALDGAGLATAPGLAIAAAIDGFRVGDALDLTGIAFDSAGSAAITAGNILRVGENGHTYDLQLDQNFGGERFKLAANSGGTQITLLPVGISSAAIQPGSGAFDAGQALSITLTMGGPVTVTGTPTLSLNDGGVASYDAAHSTSTALVFDYTVGSGQNIAVLAATSLNLSGGATITDGENNAADLTLPASALFTGVEIDTTAPTGVHNTGLALGLGQTALIPASALRFADNLSSDAALTYTLTSAPADGLLLDNEAAVTSFTQADIDNGLISYQETSATASSDSFGFTVTDAAGNTTAGQQFQLTIQPPPANPASTSGLRYIGTGSFGGSNSDILWQSSAGTPTIWLMNGASATIATEATPPPAWQIAAVGDFNTDGQADILWQSTVEQPAIWLMNGTGVSNAAALSTIPPTNWHMVGAGDFYDTGFDDAILWQSSGGQPALWLMNGTTIVNSGALPNPGAGSQIIGAGDFWDTGHDNSVLLQTASGTPEVWELQGVNVVQQATLPTPPADWHIRGIGDFYNSGFDDGIVWQNDSGGVAIWRVAGGNLVNGFTLPSPGANWQVVGAGNFNGGSQSDILLANTGTGAAEIWFMNGAQVASTATVTDPPGAPLVIAAGMTDSAPTIGPEISELVQGGGTIITPTLAGGSLELALGAILSGTVTFASGGGTLIDEDGASDTVTGFSPGADHLAFAGDTPQTQAAIIAAAKTINGNTTLTFPDHTALTLTGVTHVTTGIFG